MTNIPVGADGAELAKRLSILRPPPIYRPTRPPPIPQTPSSLPHQIRKLLCLSLRLHFKRGGGIVPIRRGSCTYGATDGSIYYFCLDFFTSSPSTICRC